MYDLLGDDLLGDDELLGDYELMGDDELMGFRGRKRRGRGRRRVARRGYTRDRGLILGFGTQAGIAPGATVDFTANPQVPFRCKRIVVDTDNAPVAVEDIKIGKNSQLASAGAFPGSAFAANAFDVGVKFDSAYPGIDAVVTVTYNGAAMTTATITVGMFGYAAER